MSSQGSYYGIGYYKFRFYIMKQCILFLYCETMYLCVCGFKNGFGNRVWSVLELSPPMYVVNLLTSLSIRPSRYHQGKCSSQTQFMSTYTD